MRVAIVVHGLPPHACTGIETHTARLAGALARAGAEVEVFAPRFMPGLALFAQRREELDEGWAVTWVSIQDDPAPEDMAAAFAAFLDRERPDVVHFQHLLRVGFGAVEVAKKRGLPTIFNAQDFYAAGETYTALRPDLTSFDPGDRAAEARCRVARALLDRIPSLGDHHGTVLRDQLDEEQWEALHTVLYGEDATPETVEATKHVREREALMRGAFAAFDVRFATSRFLARTLSAVMGRGVEWRPAGIERAALEPIPVADVTGRAIRIGFVGGILRHKGVHVLLDAFEELGPGREGRFELAIHGASGDRAYVAAMKARAASLGVHWGGPFDRAGLARVLASIDVLVVPSLWSENAPFVIREAQTAHRPVIASRTDALAASVADEEDGLLFTQGDAKALAAVLGRLVEEDGLYARLARATRPAKSIDAEAREWLVTYAELDAAHEKSRPRPRLPAHLAPFSARLEALDELPTRQLFSRVSQGLERLGAAVGLECGPQEYMALAVGRGSRLRDGITEDARAIDWLKRSVEAQSEIRTQLEERSRWYGEQADGLRASLDALEKERDWLNETRSADAEARAVLDTELSETRESLTSLQAEREWLKETLAAGGAELDQLRSRVDDLDDQLAGSLMDREAIERHFQSLESEFASLAEHETWLRSEVTDLVRALGIGVDDVGDTERREALSAPAVADALSDGRQGLERILSELEWRRKEMTEARQASETLFARIAGGPVAIRARNWPDEAPGGAPPRPPVRAGVGPTESVPDDSHVRPVADDASDDETVETIEERVS